MKTTDQHSIDNLLLREGGYPHLPESKSAIDCSQTTSKHHPICDGRYPSLCDACNDEAKAEPQAPQPIEAKPYGYVTTLRNGTKHFYESMPYLDNAVKCDTVYLQSQAQPDYTFEELTKLVMQAATKEGHKVTMKIKWAEEQTFAEKIDFSDEVNWAESVISPAPEGGRDAN